MIQARIERYLRDAAIPYRFLPHPWARTAQETAEAGHVSGWLVMKTVAVELASGEEFICVVPAPVLVDLDAVCDVTHSRDAVLVDEDRLRELFPGCEPGAAPPFGGLWNLPVIMDSCLCSAETILMPSGRHDGLIELRADDYLDLERPLLAEIAAMPGEPWSHAMRLSPEPHRWHQR